MGFAPQKNAFRAGACFKKVQSVNWLQAPPGGKCPQKDARFGACAKENTPHQVRCATWVRQPAAGALEGIRTPGFILRRDALYPAELQAPV